MNLQQYKQRRAQTHVAYNPRGELYGSKHVRWIENASSGLRLVGFADEVNSGIRHRGWYQDEEECNVMRGVVYRLPHGRFAYGYADPNNEDCALLSFDNDADDEQEAARYADRIAELAAEKEREYQRKWQAARELESLREQLQEKRRKHTALIRAIWTGEGDDAIGARMRASVRAEVARAVKQYRDVIDEHGTEILGDDYL